MTVSITYDQPLFTISSAAKLIGISVHTLRMYEREGLILPFKKKSKQRLYSQADINRVSCLRQAINEQKISINGIKTIYSLIPCWKIMNCKENNSTCSAFTNHTSPCWTLINENNFCSSRNCRDCELYKSLNNCKEIKEKVFELTSM